MNVAAWLQNNLSTYFNNAAAQRDFRVQLRGGRSVLLFAMYLGLLILVSMFVYSQTAGTEEISVVEAQDRLRGFYQVIMYILGATVVLVAPALTATSVVMEKQRKSLDLVFSAPVSAKYYLVGKMISSYRYTWMLLVLALPVTATCVVLGGSSWSDVLIAYILLSLHALILTSAALLMSTIAAKPVSAIVWSYAVAIVYMVFTAAFGAVGSFGPGAASREAPFASCLNPFFVTENADTYTMIFSTQVPNWILVAILAVMICKLCILAAGSIIAPFVGGKEVPSLRSHVLVYMLLIATYLGYAFSSSLGATLTTAPGTGSAFAPNWSVILGVTLCWILSPLLVFLPMITCFGLDSERRFWPNGSIRLKSLLDGTPAGALPFLWALILSTAIGLALGVWMANGKLPELPFYSYVVFALGFWTFFWSLGRMSSSMFVGLRSARTLQFAAFVILVVLPVPFFSAISSGDWTSGGASRVWELYILRPLFSYDGDRFIQAFAYGAIMMVGGVVLGTLAERRVRDRLSAMRTNDGRNYAAA